MTLFAVALPGLNDLTDVKEVSLANGDVLQWNGTAWVNVPSSGFSPGGAAGGDLSGTYPDPTVARINGVSLGSTTANSGSVLIGSGTQWVSRGIGGAASLNSVGTLTLGTNVVLNTNIRQSAPNSVLGNPNNFTNNVQDISSSADNQVLRRSGTLVAFGAINLASTNAVTNTLARGNGGTGIATAPTNGQLLIGNSTDYTLATLSNGAGISITNGAGSITIASTITQYTNEDAQDAVGGILTDTATIDFTYDDSTPSIAADVKTNSITNSLFRQSAALSVVGRASNSIGNVADIVAPTAGQPLRRSYSNTIDFGPLTLSDANVFNGILGPSNGGTGNDSTSFTRYSLIFADLLGVFNEVLPNTTTNRRFLRMTGTGAAGDLPVWDSISTSDISGLGTIATQNANNVTITGGTISSLTGLYAGSAVDSAYRAVIAPTGDGTQNALFLGRSDNVNEGAEIAWQGSGAFSNWTTDIFQENFRIFSGANVAKQLQVFNTNGGSSAHLNLFLKSTGTDTIAGLIAQNDARDWRIQVRGDASDRLVFRDETAGEDRLIIDTSGAVTVGSDTSFARLFNVFEDSSGSDIQARFEQNNPSAFAGVEVLHASAGAAFTLQQDAAGLSFITAPNELLVGTSGMVIASSPTSIDAAAILELTSTTKGFLPPRMTTTQRDAISSPPDGLMLYNATTGKFQGRASGAWVDFH